MYEVLAIGRDSFLKMGPLVAFAARTAMSMSVQNLETADAVTSSGSSAVSLPASNVTANLRSEERVQNTNVRELNVLIADDNEINQQFVSAILDKAGHHLEIATNGREAVAAVSSFNFDVVLMDLPNSGTRRHAGRQTNRLLPPPNCNIQIIALTADAMAVRTGARTRAGLQKV